MECPPRRLSTRVRLVELARACDIEGTTRRRIERLQQAAQTAAKRSEEVGEILQTHSVALTAQVKELMENITLVSDTLQRCQRTLVNALSGVSENPFEVGEFFSSQSESLTSAST